MKDITSADSAITQSDFWEHAGRIGYDKVRFANTAVKRFTLTKEWKAMLDIAHALGLGTDSRILDLGCGDGRFAEEVLSAHFGRIDAFDRSVPAIERAKASSRSGKIGYFIQDATTFEYGEHDSWDAAIMLGLLHHTKAFADRIVSRLAGVCSKIIILEPNGDNPLRKIVERHPLYIKAGEESFRLKELKDLFERNGFRVKHSQKLCLAPGSLPEVLLPAFKAVANIIESHPSLEKLISAYVLGFERFS